LACDPELGWTLAASAAEQFLQAVDGQLLGDIDVLAAAVIALAGIAFGILVGQLRTLRGHHRVADIVLRGDQLDMLFLTPIFVFDRLPDLGIHFRQGVFSENIVRLSSLEKGERVRA
jgi:hypothetical protein